MPVCMVCNERYYYASEIDPPERCVCGMNFGYDLWVDTGTWREYLNLRWLQFRWWFARKTWVLAVWATPEGGE